MGKKKASMSAINFTDEPVHVDHLKPAPKRRPSVTEKLVDGDGNEKDIVKLLEPSIKTFDDLNSFEHYIKGETFDNDFDYYHAKLNYLPPFVLNEIHDNLEKIKPTMNARSKKFVRHLNHHIKRHLLTDIQTMSGVDYKFEKAHVERLQDGRIIFHFKDYSDHGFDQEARSVNRHWSIDLDVECFPDNPYVNIDLKSLPIEEEI
ncbi:hypothetical protein BVG19_g3138 [[Candida] boidinii]|nr:hypothetical protein BVG19_g3138 [[Candida] boidinii]OWB53434.1 hypothetical protein B5S27_g5030 [[Candida] boidinii]